MPLPGDQHRDTAATTNPFLDQKPHITDFTAQEIATLQSRLDKQLGPEYISTRPGAGGGKVHYLAAEKVINLANEVFGFNGWSSAIQNVQIDFVDENAQNGKITLGLSTIVRVTLRDGTYHEDIGYGHIENCKGKAAAFEKAKKEAATDAMKRALRNFGNVLGNCLYDKDYLQKVTKVKIAPTRWDADNLHRHPDYAPIKRESIVDVEGRENKDASAATKRQISLQSAASYGSMEFEDDFGGNPFDDSDVTHPDEVRLDDSLSGAGAQAKSGAGATPGRTGQMQRQGVPRVNSMPQLRPPNVQHPPANQIPQAPQRPAGPPRPPSNLHQAQTTRPPVPQITLRPGHQSGPHQQQGPIKADGVADLGPQAIQQRAQPTSFGSEHTMTDEQLDNTGPVVPQAPPSGVPEGFISVRSILDQPPEAPPPSTAQAFNPHADTPSIRRTHGLNPGKSAPIMRSAIVGAAAIEGQSAPPQRPTTPNGPPNFPQHHPQQPPQASQGNGLNGTTTSGRPNLVNPSADMSRRIGMPPTAAVHTMQNRSAYKPPTPLKRPPLADISNIQQADGTGEAKKAKLDQPAVIRDGGGDGQNVNAAAGIT